MKEGMQDQVKRGFEACWREEVVGTEQDTISSRPGRGTWGWNVTHRKARPRFQPTGPAFCFHWHLTVAQGSYRTQVLINFFAKQQLILGEEGIGPLEF